MATLEYEQLKRVLGQAFEELGVKRVLLAVWAVFKERPEQQTRAGAKIRELLSEAEDVAWSERFRQRQGQPARPCEACGGSGKVKEEEPTGKW